MRVVGRVAHDEVPGWLAAADVVCGPALIEPFGQALLEAMACGRTVVATRIGGPPEFVPPEAGVLVDPLDVGELARALEAAAALPSPNEAARAAAAAHDVRRAGGAGGGDPPASRSRSASLTSTSGRDALLEPVLARERERLLVALRGSSRRRRPASAGCRPSRAGCGSSRAQPRRPSPHTVA